MPATNPAIQLVADADALYQAAAAEFVRQAGAAVETKDTCTVALSGGSTPKGLYGLLANDPTWRGQVPWGNIHVFWGDERHVPPDHPDSNYRMAHEALLSKVPMPQAHVHRIKSEHPDARQAADDYEQTLRAFFHLAAGQFPRIDLIFLGLGPEGHTASLFPGTKALHDTRRLVVATSVGKLFTDRITLTPAVLNHAAGVASGVGVDSYVCGDFVRLGTHLGAFHASCSTAERSDAIAIRADNDFFIRSKSASRLLGLFGVRRSIFAGCLRQVSAEH